MVVFAISVRIQLNLINVESILMKVPLSTTPINAGLFRRLAALVYDSLIVVALLFLASAVAMLVVSMIMGSEAIVEQKILVENPVFFSWLIFCWFYYYAWCWRKGGQTLGMKAWRLKLVAEQEEIFSYKNALLRFFSGLFGLSNVWVLVPGKRGWHDIISHSNVILTEKNT